MIAPRNFALCSAAWTLLSAVPLLAADPPAAPAAKPAATVSYFRDIRPIFQVHCQGCHQPAKADGRVRDDQPATVSSKGAKAARRPSCPASPTRATWLARSRPTTARPRCPRKRSRWPRTRSRRFASGSPKAPRTTRRCRSARSIDMEHPPVYEGAPVLTALDFSPDDTPAGRQRLSRNPAVRHKADGSWAWPRGAAGRSDRSASSRSPFRPTASRWPSRGGSPGRLGEVQVWDVAAAQASLLACRSRTTRSTASAGRPTASKIAFGCADNTLRAIDAATGKQVLYQGAHSDWVLDTVFSNEGTLPDLGQPRPLDEAGRSGHAAVRRQHHQHHARRAQGRPGRGRSPSEQGRAADRRGRRRAEDLPDAAHQGPRDRRRLQPDQGLRSRAGTDLRRCSSTPTAAASWSAAAWTARAKCGFTRPTAASCCTSSKASRAASMPSPFHTNGKRRGLGRLRRPGPSERCRDRQARSRSFRPCPMEPTKVAAAK